MSIELRLPQLAETVTSAKLGTWLKQEGDTVEAGEPIVEVETDKTNVELEAPASGVVHKIHVKAGTDGLETGALLAVISEGAEPAGADDGQTRATEDAAPPTEVSVSGGPTAMTIQTPDLAIAETSFHEQPLSTMRRVTAMRLQQAKQTVPHFYLRMECTVDAVLELRTRINEHSPDVKLTLTDIIVRAAALALRKVPQANSTWADDAIRVYDAADIAVAVNTPMGLITPIIRQADRKGLGAISQEMKALTERARQGALTPEEYSGGTFTISNLGMYAVESLYAIVNPPQSCILGVGAAVKRPVVVGDELAIGTIATCTLSADHRAIDGATGAEFLASFRMFIEEPGLLAL